MTTRFQALASINCRVTAVDLDQGIATVLDGYGKNRTIRVDMRRGGGVYPRVDDIWMICQSGGDWVFDTLVRSDPPEVLGSTLGNAALESLLVILEDHGFIKDGTVTGGVGSPVGAIIMFGAATPPTGWLRCDGSLLSRTDYADLFAAIGTTWGAGDGSTTFAIPNLTHRFPVGAGTGAYDPGDIGGAETVVLAQGNIPEHTHTVTDHVHPISHTHDINPPSTTSGINSVNHTHNFGGEFIADVAATGSASRFRAGGATASGGNSVDHTHVVNIAEFTSGGTNTSNSGNPSTNPQSGTGSGLNAPATAHENRPPFLAVPMIIKALP